MTDAPRNTYDPSQRNVAIQKPAKTSGRCPACQGSGIDPLPGFRARITSLTIADLVRLTGMSRSMMSRVISPNPSQRRRPSLTTLAKLARGLGCDRETILRFFRL